MGFTKYMQATKWVSVSQASSRNSRLIHYKRVPNNVTSQCHIIIWLFFVFSSEWATLEAHNFNTITNFKRYEKYQIQRTRNYTLRQKMIANFWQERPFKDTKVWNGKRKLPLCRWCWLLSHCNCSERPWFYGYLWQHFQHFSLSQAVLLP